MIVFPARLPQGVSLHVRSIYFGSQYQHYTNPLLFLMIVLMFLIILNELRNYFGNSKTFINTGFQEVNSILIHSLHKGMFKNTLEFS